MGKPFTTQALAERWECSPNTIRAMIHRGELKAFKVGGKLLRVSADEVEKWETAEKTEGSSGSEANGRLRGRKMDTDTAALSARMIGHSPKPVLVRFGTQDER
jgi:excisionase family DNA binding protein